MIIPILRHTLVHRFHGVIFVQIRDYRDCLPSNRMQTKAPSRMDATGWMPKVEIVILQPTMDNIIKDVAKMADESWSYTDLLVGSLFPKPDA